MKRIYAFATLVSLLLASVACSRDAVEDVGASLDNTRLTIEIPESRTSLGEKVDGEHPVFWSEGDKIVVNGTPSTSIEIREGGQSATFDFLGTLLSTPYNVTYPYTEGSLCADDRATVVFAAEQQFVEGTFAEESAPMCGYSEGGSNISLKHLAGLARLSVKGVATISKIEIIAEEGVALSGEFDVNCQEGSAVAIEGKTSNTVTYIVNQTLSQETATIFHIAVPAGNLGQCKFVLSDDSGLKMNAKWNATDVKAGIIREFKEFAYKGGTTIDIENFSSESDDLLINGKVTNKIFYTSSDGNVVTPYASDVFGANIVSNTYENGEGVITFDGDVTKIGSYAFSGCSSLTTITIGDSVTSIGERAFDACGLTSVTIGDSVTSIGNSAFRDCSSLTSVTIGNSIKSIDGSAFSNCASLTSVYITNLSAWCKIDYNSTLSNPCCNGAKLYLNGSELTEVTIPSDITEIPFAAFSGCSSLTSVTIPDSVTTFGDTPFHKCDNLTAFYGNYASEDNRCLIVDGEICSFAPSGLTTYTIPDSATKIGCNAFSYCDNLESVTIPDCVTLIRQHAFSGCAGLTSVTIGNGVTEIGMAAFYQCGSLTGVTIGRGVTSIGAVAFYECSSLTEVYCGATTPPAGNIYMFDNNASGRTIYVPAESVEAYKTANYWSNYAEYIVGANITELPQYGTEDGELVY